MVKILIKCEGNNSPKYDGKIWEEELKFIVSINGQTVDLHRQPEVKRGDQVVICRPGKGGKKGRNWKGTVMSQSDLANKSLQAGPHSSSSRKGKADDQLGGAPKKGKPTASYVALGEEISLPDDQHPMETGMNSQKNRDAPLESESVDQTVTDVGSGSSGCSLKSKSPVPPRDVKSGGRPLESKSPVSPRDDKSGGRPLESDACSDPIQFQVPHPKTSSGSESKSPHSQSHTNQDLPSSWNSLSGRRYPHEYVPTSFLSSPLKTSSQIGDPFAIQATRQGSTGLHGFQLEEHNAKPNLFNFTARVESSLSLITSTLTSLGSNQALLGLKIDAVGRQQEKLELIQNRSNDEFAALTEKIKKSNTELTEKIKKSNTELTDKINRLNTELTDKFYSIEKILFEISRHQSHIQTKQDQLAMKQDLMQKSISNDLGPPSIVSSPIDSPPVCTFNSWSINQPRFYPPFAGTPHRYRSHSCMPTIAPRIEDPKVEPSIPTFVEEDLGSILDEICSVQESSAAMQSTTDNEDAPASGNDFMNVPVSTTPVLTGRIDSGVGDL